MHTIRDIARLATMLAGLIAPRIRLGFVPTMPHLRLDYALASISCEHCRSLRNHPHCVPRHIIYYFITFHFYHKKQLFDNIIYLIVKYLFSGIFIYPKVIIRTHVRTYSNTNIYIYSKELLKFEISSISLNR